MRPLPFTIAVMFALGCAGALAQNQAAPTPVPPKPANSPTYGPVLNPQATPATPPPAGTPAAGEARPQAQEERAGQPPTSGKHNEVDPSARPAPEAVQPQQQGSQQRQQPARKDKQAQRRPGAVQRIESTPRIAVPAPAPMPRVAPPSAPSGSQSNQVMGCMGSMCTDANGTTYNAGGPGNTAVSSSGRLCTRNGATMQCL